jgi:hypothetical protein
MEYKLEFSYGSVLLNEEQYKVVSSPVNENQRILASAGSGKTTTITARIAYLIENYGIRPSNILLATFSRAAAKEMIERVTKLIGPVNLCAGTFHSLSAQTLKEFAPHLLKDEPFIDELPYRLVSWLDTELGKKWKSRFKNIIIDEFQDINDIQWKLINSCKNDYTNVTIVGDDAQNIYTWRGSSVDFILNFHKYINNVKDYQLCINYRSIDKIVTVANAIMRFIPTLPFKQKMIANTFSESNIPEVHYFFRSSDEQDWIVNMIDKALLNSNHRIAVISRYNNDLYKIEDKLHKKYIKYALCTQYDYAKTESKPQRVTLTTIHASKGLEWDVVFFMNLHDDIFPSRKTDDEIVCERRLFYVGITRAKKHLFLTYSRQERSISRFVREIPRPFLKFNNVSSFKLSTTSFGNVIMSLDDMIKGFDGNDWDMLRKKDAIPYIDNCKQYSIYKFSKIFNMPNWVKENDVRNTWFEMLKWVTMREAAHCLELTDQLRTPEIMESLLTMRIYKEDIEFWQEYEIEMEHIAHKFLKHTINMPSIEYYQLEEYVINKLPHLKWSVKEMSKALMILSKIRGQLRPLRHNGFDLNEFNFGYVRNSVPTELRPFVLSSWHKILDKNVLSSNIISDLWKIASVESINEGRNKPLYQLDSINEELNKDEIKDILITIENAIPNWIITQENLVLNYTFEVENIKPIVFDILTDTCAYNIYFDVLYNPTMEDKILLLLKEYAYEELFDKQLNSIGFINMATGIIIQYEISDFMREQMSYMWVHLQQKYKMFEEE